MPAYDDYFFDTPAPLAKVTLRDQEHDTILPDVSMLLDSGADVTLVPQDAVHVLGVSVSSNESYELRGFDGHTSFVQVVQLDLIFLAKARIASRDVNDLGAGVATWTTAASVIVTQISCSRTVLASIKSGLPKPSVNLE
jgi:aspartyl protease